MVKIYWYLHFSIFIFIIFVYRKTCGILHCCCSIWNLFLPSVLWFLKFQNCPWETQPNHIYIWGSLFFLFISRIANIFLVMFCIAKTNIYNILIETIDVCVIWLFYVLVKLIFINFKINHILICDICAMILKHMAGCFLSNT